MLKKLSLLFFYFVIPTLHSLAKEPTNNTPTLLKQGKIAQAITEAERLAERRQTNYNFLYQLIFLNYTQRNYQEVIDLSIKLNKLTVNKPAPFLRSKAQPFYYTAEYPEGDFSEGLRFIPRAPIFYQHVYYSRENSRLIRDSLNTFTAAYEDGEYTNLHTPQPTTLFQAKNFCMIHLVSIYQTSRKNHALRNKIKAIPEAEYLIEYLNNLGDRYSRQIATNLKPNSPLINTLEKKLSTYLLEVSQRLNARQLNDLIDLSENTLPRQYLRLRIQRKINQKNHTAIFPLLENSQLSPEQKSILLLEQANLTNALPEKQLVPFILKYHALIKNKQSEVRDQLERLWIKTKKDQSAEETIRDINFLLENGNHSPVSKKHLSHFSAFYGTQNWPTFYQPSLPDNALGLLFSRKKPHLEKLVPHIKQINSSPLQIHLLARLAKDKQAKALLSQAIEREPHNIDLRFLAISSIHSSKLSNTEKSLQKLPHLEAIYTQPLSNHLQSIMDEFTIELLKVIAADPKLKKQFTPKPYQQEALRRTVKTLGFSRHPEFYEMLGMRREYQLLREAEDLQQDLQKKASQKESIDIVRTFTKKLKLGKQDEALNTATNYIKQVWGSRNQYNAIRIYQEAKKKRLHTALTKQLTPQDPHFIRQWVLFHNYMLECKDENGIKLAVSTLAKNAIIPLQQRARVAMILMPLHQEKALDLLFSIPLDLDHQVIAEFGNSYKRKSLTKQRRTKHLQGFLHYLKAYKKRTGQSVKMSHMRNTFYAITHFEEPNIPAYNSNKKQNLKLTPLSEERANIISAIAKELLNYPNISETAFVAYLQNNKLTDEEIMTLSASILQKLSKHAPLGFQAKLSNYEFPYHPNSAFDYAVHYLISQPAKAKLFYEKQLLDTLDQSSSDPEYSLYSILKLASSKDNNQISLAVTEYFSSSRLDNFLVTSHYNPLLTKELAKQYFAHIDRYLDKVQKLPNNNDKKKSHRFNMDRQISYALNYATPVVLLYLEKQNQNAQWENCIKKLALANPDTNPALIKKQIKIKTNIPELLDQLISHLKKPKQILTLLEISRRHPDLLFKINIKLPSEPSELIHYLTELNILTKNPAIDFMMLSRTQSEALIQYCIHANKPIHIVNDARRSTYLRIANQIRLKVNSDALNPLIAKDYQVSWFCFKACKLSSNPKKLFALLHTHAKLFKQLNKKQQTDLINILGIIDNHSSELEKHPDLLNDLGLSASKIVDIYLTRAKQLFTTKSLDSPADYFIIAQNKHTIKALSPTHPKLAAQVALKMMELESQSKKQRRRYPDLKIRVQRAFNSSIPYRDIPQNFIDSVTFQLELMKHPQYRYYRQFSSLQHHRLAHNIKNSSAKYSRDPRPKKRIPYVKKLIQALDQYSTEEQQNNLRLCLLYTFCSQYDTCKYLPPILTELEQSDPQFAEKHSSLIQFIASACHSLDRDKAKRSPIKPFQMKYMRKKTPLIPNLRPPTKTPHLFSLLNELSSKENHLALLNKACFNYNHLPEFIPYTVKCIEQLEDTTLLLEYDNLLQYLAIAHSKDPNQELVKTIRNLLRKITYKKNTYRTSNSYQHLAYIATNGNHLEENREFLQYLLKKAPALNKQLYYQLKSALYDTPISEPLNFSDYHPDRYYLQFTYNRKLEQVFQKIDLSKLSNLERFYYYRALAYLNDDPTEKHLLKAKRHARIKQLASSMHIKHSKTGFKLYHDCAKLIALEANIDIAKACSPYLKQTTPQTNIFAKKHLLNYKLQNLLLSYYLAIHRLELKELNSVIDKALAEDKGAGHIRGEHTELIVSAAVIAALDCVHKKDLKRLEKLLPLLRRLLDLEIRNWNPGKEAGKLMNLNKYCHAHIMKTCELAHLLCNQQQEFEKLRLTFSEEQELSAWKACKRFSINKLDSHYLISISMGRRHQLSNETITQEGNYYLKNSTVVYEAFLANLPSAFGKDPHFYRDWHIHDQDCFSPKKMIPIANKYFKATQKNLHQKHLILAHLHEIIGERQEAIQHWQNVIKQVRTNQPEQLFPYQLRYVNALYHIKDAKTALLTLNQIRSTKPADSKQIEIYKKALQKRRMTQHSDR